MIEQSIPHKIRTRRDNINTNPQSNIMDKESLIEAIKEGIEFEEKAIPKLLGFYKKEIGWEGLPQKKLDELKDILGTLIREAKHHYRMLSELLPAIEKERKNEY